MNEFFPIPYSLRTKSAFALRPPKLFEGGKATAGKAFAHLHISTFPHFFLIIFAHLKTNA
jgi:hypothetical protein